MKKQVLILVMFLLAFGIKAQDKKFDFGIKAGVNFADIQGADQYDAQAGLLIGVTAELGISDKFSVQPELLYSEQGGKVGDEVDLQLNYIAVPVLAKYYVAKGFAVEIGPQVSFLVKDEFEFGDGTTMDPVAENMDVSAALGFGYKTNSGIFTQVRYVAGLTTIDENPDVKNAVFQLSVGYQF
ncbi:porin family protein [Spongiivirga sp. MCCC 1A20706]|uniref:porin family protein n=1 Tax=Spongiivirga sp. MCCC 1A20706 TaxID=3160963 RepID=UPI0039779B34